MTDTIATVYVASYPNPKSAEAKGQFPAFAFSGALEIKRFSYAGITSTTESFPLKQSVQLRGVKSARKAELIALRTALRACRQAKMTHITTSSEFIYDALTKGWLERWQHNGWRKSNGNSVSNVSLWLDIIEELDDRGWRFSIAYAPADTESEIEHVAWASTYAKSLSGSKTATGNTIVASGVDLTDHVREGSFPSAKAAIRRYRNHACECEYQF